MTWTWSSLRILITLTMAASTWGFLSSLTLAWRSWSAWAPPLPPWPMPLPPAPDPEDPPPWELILLG